MTDPVPHENWIDAPYPFAPSTDPPDDIDKALDTLADAIVRANGGEQRNMASHLGRNPAVAKVFKVLGRLPAARLVAFFDRHVGREPDAPDVLMSGIAASGAADRMARAQVFGRVTMAPRLHALERACKAAALERAGDRP
jgi:hypothetical protein